MNYNKQRMLNASFSTHIYILRNKLPFGFEEAVGRFMLIALFDMFPTYGMPHFNIGLVHSLLNVTLHGFNQWRSMPADSAASLCVSMIFFKNQLKLSCFEMPNLGNHLMDELKSLVVKLSNGFRKIIYIFFLDPIDNQCYDIYVPGNASN
jgi:hypothetical protein